jgi:hypothetical protein
LLFTGHQERAGAEGQPVPGKLDRSFLVAADPVGEQRQLHVMHDSVAMEAIAARVAHKALHGVGLLLGRPAEQVASREQSAPLREIITEKRPSAV